MKCPTPISLRKPTGAASERMLVPCGKCGACKKNRRDSWSFRLKEEYKYSKSAYFITLTYTDDDLPYTESGEITLEKKDIQDFIKRVRIENQIHSDHQVRYYAVGEYGTKTDRPHYHIIIFNIHEATKNQILQLWKNGQIHVSPITEARIHYVTKYHVNPNKTDGSRNPEFATMSRRPGLGSQYIKKNAKWHIENEYFYVINNGFKQNIPRYYKEKLFTKIQLQDFKHESEKKANDLFKRKADRLEKTGVQSPESYINQSEIIQAKNINNKSKSSTELF